MKHREGQKAEKVNRAMARRLTCMDLEKRQISLPEQSGDRSRIDRRDIDYYIIYEETQIAKQKVFEEIMASKTYISMKNIKPKI